MDIIQGDEIPMNPLGGGMDEVSHQLGESFHDMGYGLGRQVGEGMIHSGAEWVKNNPYTAGGLGVLAGGAALALAPEIAAGSAGLASAEALGIVEGGLGLAGFEGADVAAFLAGGAL